MKKRKLKAFVLPTTYLLITITIFLGIVFMSGGVKKTGGYNFSTDIIKDPTVPVVETDEQSNTAFISPVDTTIVNIGINFYSKEDDQTRQENSLIYYENTYLPNTGILYTSDKEFEIKSVSNGKVLEVKEDEIMGSYVVIEHNTNLKTYYYGLTNILVKADDEVTSGTVIGNSKENNISKGNNSFLFEVNYKGETINPEKLIDSKISDFE